MTAEASRRWRERYPERVVASRRRYRAANPQAAAIASRGWRERNPEKQEHANAVTRKSRKRFGEDHPRQWRRQQKSWQLKTQYGITLAEFERMRRAQKGLCAICKRKPRGAWKVLAVDHCHQTKQVRALLCHQCNTAIALVGDSPRLLRAAAKYLERYL